jgi:ABC-type phosphate/phosphonate transport system permease subunit
MGYKWIALIASFMITFMLIYWAVLPLVNFMFLSSKEASVLHDALSEFIPQDMTIMEIMDDK